MEYDAGPQGKKEERHRPEYGDSRYETQHHQNIKDLQPPPCFGRLCNYPNIPCPRVGGYTLVSCYLETNSCAHLPKECKLIFLFASNSC